MTAPATKDSRSETVRRSTPLDLAAPLVRRAGDLDAPEIIRLCRQLGYAVQLRSLRTHLSANDDRNGPWALVAVDATDRVVGFVHAFRCPAIMEDAGRIEIGALIVDKSHRRRGIGRNLVRAIEDRARRARARVVRVRTNVIRTDANAFYTDLGFQQVKIQTVFERSQTRRVRALSRGRTAR